MGRGHPWGEAVRFAYADPPYPGCAHRYPEKTEVNHAALIARLVSDYPDGFALSTGSAQLQYVLGLCPSGVRIAAWVKPFAAFKPNVNPAYAWEAVIWTGGRKRTRDEATVRDWVSANITLQRGVVGAKPDQFWHWLLDLFGYQPGDTVDDLYPGTGRLAAILAARNAQLALATPGGKERGATS
jgi:hypothetical protein